jgi:hypothetical protein
METEYSEQEERSYRSGGNERERLEVVSGKVIIADQFALVNPLLIDLTPEQLLGKLTDFGCVVTDLEIGSYSVLRNPFEQKVLVCPLGSVKEDFSFSPADFSSVGTVEVDTRCLILFDANLLTDSEFLSDFRSSWAQGGNGQKQARDLMRELGGAVRYGFSKQFEQLSVGVDSSSKERIGIWG